MVGLSNTMLHIILLILKIIGILLVTLLGTLIVVLLLVLFIPIRYRLYGKKYEELIVHGKVTWLLHVISIRLDYEKGQERALLRLFGFPLFDSMKKKEKRKRQKRKKSKQSRSREKEGHTDRKQIELKKVEETKIETNDKQKEKLQEETTDQAETMLIEVNSKIHQQEISKIQLQAEKITQQTKENEKQRNEKRDKRKRFQSMKLKIQQIIKKIREVPYKIRKFIATIKEKMNSFFQFLKKIKVEKNKIIHFIQEEENRSGMKVVFKSIRKLLSRIKPKKLRANLEIGTEDPCTTGQLLGMFGLLYGYVGTSISIIPNFEQQVYKGEVEVKGSIQIAPLMFIAIRLLRDKQFKCLFHNIKNLKEEA